MEWVTNKLKPEPKNVIKQSKPNDYKEPQANSGFNEQYNQKLFIQVFDPCLLRDWKHSYSNNFITIIIPETKFSALIATKEKFPNIIGFQHDLILSIRNFRKPQIKSKYCINGTQLTNINLTTSLATNVFYAFDHKGKLLIKAHGLDELLYKLSKLEPI